LHQPFKGVFIEWVLTNTRIHDDFVSLKNRENEINYWSIIAIVKYQTAQDLVVYNNVGLICWFLSSYIQYAVKLANEKVAIPFWIPAF
jgi:hypothetical protein